MTMTPVLSTSPNSSLVSIKLFLVVVEVCKEVSVVVLSLNLRKKGGSVFSDCGQRFTRYPTKL